MRRLLILLVLLLPLPAWAETRVALVIGNGAYEAVPRLPNPPLDAQAMAAKLRRLGFQVTEGLDLGKAAMDRLVRRFGEEAGRADVAMVFYAGHGIQVAGRNYLVPVDAKAPAREQDLRYDFVDVAGIMDELAGAKVLRIVVLDACRDNPLAASLGRTLGRSLGTTRGLAAPSGMDNTLVAYATAADAVAEDGAGGNSPFTQALLAHIEDPGLDVRLMFGRVRDAVRQTTSNRQNPFVYASMGGDGFAFNPGQGGAAPSPPAATPPAAAGSPPPAGGATPSASRDPAPPQPAPPGPSKPAVVAGIGKPPPSGADPSFAPVQPRVQPPQPSLPQPTPQSWQPGQVVFFGGENTEFGVPPQATLKADVGTPTPISIPGARAVSTTQVATEMRQNRSMVLIDALENPHPQTIAGAVHLPLAGRYGNFRDGFQSQLARDLGTLTRGQREMYLVFFCQGVRCWESYNAALRARAAGYPNVFWYRGGLQAWAEAGLPMQPLNGR